MAEEFVKKVKPIAGSAAARSASSSRAGSLR